MCILLDTLDDYPNLSFGELHCDEPLLTLEICYLISTLNHVSLVMVVDVLEYALNFSLDLISRNRRKHVNARKLGFNDNSNSLILNNVF